MIIIEEKLYRVVNIMALYSTIEVVGCCSSQSGEICKRRNKMGFLHCIISFVLVTQQLTLCHLSIWRNLAEWDICRGGRQVEGADSLLFIHTVFY